MSVKTNWFFIHGTRFQKKQCQTLTLKNVSNEPFSMYSVIIITGLDRVTTPCRNITLGCSNCPMIDASVRKSLRALSELPGFRVLMATSTSTEGEPRTFNFPLHTSPNSPPPDGETTNVNYCNWCFFHSVRGRATVVEYYIQWYLRITQSASPWFTINTESWTQPSENIKHSWASQLRLTLILFDSNRKFK